MLHLPNTQFPFLFGGTFIEGHSPLMPRRPLVTFPFLFGGTFIEGAGTRSLHGSHPGISLPFRRGFH